MRIRSNRAGRARSASGRPRILRPVARIADAHGTDDYLEAVYEMHEEGVEVVQARLAERLGVSRAAV